MTATSKGKLNTPWLPSQERWCFCRVISDIAKCIGAICILLYIMVFSAILAILELPKILVRLFLREGTRCFGFIVEHAYALSICKLHVNFSRMIQMHWGRRRYHSRYSDIRTELILTDGVGGNCFIHSVPLLGDNYAYVVVDASQLATSRACPGRPNEWPGGLPCVVVDPCDAQAVVSALTHIAERHYSEFGGLRLEAVLCTHRHWDHAGGNRDLLYMAKADRRAEEMREAHGIHSRDHDDEALAQEDAVVPHEGPFVRFSHPFRVYAGEADRAPGCTHPLRHGDRFRAGYLDFEALGAPGHTEGSVMFRLATPCSHPDDRPGEVAGTDTPAVGSEAAATTPGLPVDVMFTGDTLFSGGCGAQFEGCDLDIEHCFATVLEECKLPDALLFPGHEYTCNLLEMRVKDAMDSWCAVEPPGQFLSNCGAFYIAAHRRSLRDKVPTVPTTLANERLLNPHFDRGLRRYAETLVALVEADMAPAAGSVVEGDAKGATPQLVMAAAPVGHSATSTGPAPALPAGSMQDESRLPLLQHGTAPAGAALAAEAGRRSQAPRVSDAEVVAGTTDGVPDGGFFTGTAAPAFKFAFFYRTDMEEFRAALATGRISGEEAAAQLLEMERRVFYHPLTTGQADCFSGEGLTQMEEMQVLGLIPPPPPLGTEKLPDAQTPQSREGEDEESRAPRTANGKESTEDDDSESSEDSVLAQEAVEHELNCRLPSREMITLALKVLGVPPHVPVGPKAPCKDEELPISIDRLEVVLRHLGTSEQHLQALMNLLQTDGFAEDINPGMCGTCFGGSPAVALADEESVESSNGASAEGDTSDPRQISATKPPDILTRPARPLLPLRTVLQSLRPSPVKHPATFGSFAHDCWLGWRREWRLLKRDLRRCCKTRKVRQPPPPPEEPVAAQPVLSWEERVILAQREERRRLGAVEQIFGQHTLDKCPCCVGCFRGAAPGGLRRRATPAAISGGAVAAASGVVVGASAGRV
mmetsp:Transcript_30214/g.87705  ORF Transcript_30214/g.87705 Transcript_30214/m.87705 type:complete len:984 (-) Transcript_30214:70-3021(-)